MSLSVSVGLGPGGSLGKLNLQVDNLVSTLKPLKDKLLGDPQAATDQLHTVLIELSKTYQAIDSELTNYLNLVFDSDEDSVLLAHETEALQSLTSGGAQQRVGEARGHCGKIRFIYTHYLDTWFSRTLAPSEYATVKHIFVELSTVDDDLVGSVDAVAKWLTNEATAVLPLVRDKKYAEAQSHIYAAGTEIAPVQQLIHQKLGLLAELEANFQGTINRSPTPPIAPAPPVSGAH